MRRLNNSLARPRATAADRHIFPRQTACCDQSGQLNPVIVRGADAGLLSPPLASALAVAFLLAACQSSIKPASTAGECGVFNDPGFAVMGATRKDQRWISSTQEKGVRVCGWPRPKAEPEPSPAP